MGHRALLAALHIYKARVPPSSALPALLVSHSFCHPLPSASLFAPKWPRSHRLLRCPSPVLGAPITSSQTPQWTTWVRPGSYLDPHTRAVTSPAHSPTARSHLPRQRLSLHGDVDGMPGLPRRRLPTRALALKVGIRATFLATS